MSKTKPIVHLRVYRGIGRGTSLSYDADGNVQNESILVKLTYDTLSWANYLRHIKVGGFIKAVVEKVTEGGSVEKVQKEVDKAMADIVTALSPQEQRIADLEAKLEALTSGKKSDEPKTDEPKTDGKKEDEPTEIEKVRDEYEKVMGKKAFHGWEIEVLKEKMAEKKAENE